MSFTVAELRKAIEGLPDDMPVFSYDLGGYPNGDCVGVDVYEPTNSHKDRYFDKDVIGKKILLIGA